MRHRLELLAAALLAGSHALARAQSPDAAAVAVQQQGNAFAAALLREDYGAVAASTCSPVLARVGGVAALARQIEVSFKVMQRQGRELLRMHFDAPSAVFDGAVTRFALVPYRSVVRVDGGRVALESYYLAAQNKGADDWCFVDTAALTPASLRELFPGAPPGLHLPPLAPAVLEHDPLTASDR